MNDNVGWSQKWEKHLCEMIDFCMVDLLTEWINFSSLIIVEMCFVKISNCSS